MPNFPCTTCGAHGAYVGPETNGPVCASCGNPLREAAAPSIAPEQEAITLPDPPAFTTDEVTEMARRGYTAHVALFGPRNFRGEPLVAWTDLPPSTQEAWIAATEAISGAVREVLLTHVRNALTA